MEITPQETLESSLLEALMRNTQPAADLPEAQPGNTIVESALADKDYCALSLMGLLSEIELPNNESIAPYARCLIDELKHGLITWRRSTIAEYVQDLTTLWLGARLLRDILDPGFWKKNYPQIVRIDKIKAGQPSFDGKPAPLYQPSCA